MNTYLSSSLSERGVAAALDLFNHIITLKLMTSTWIQSKPQIFNLIHIFIKPSSCYKYIVNRIKVKPNHNLLNQANVQLI